MSTKSGKPRATVSGETRARWELLRSLAGVSRSDSDAEDERMERTQGSKDSNNAVSGDWTSTVQSRLEYSAGKSEKDRIHDQTSEVVGEAEDSMGYSEGFRSQYSEPPVLEDVDVIPSTETAYQDMQGPLTTRDRNLYTRTALEEEHNIDETAFDSGGITNDAISTSDQNNEHNFLEIGEGATARLDQTMTKLPTNQSIDDVETSIKARTRKLERTTDIDTHEAKGLLVEDLNLLASNPLDKLHLQRQDDAHSGTNTLSLNEQQRRSKRSLHTSDYRNPSLISSKTIQNPQKQTQASDLNRTSQASLQPASAKIDHAHAENSKASTKPSLEARMRLPAQKFHHSPVASQRSPSSADILDQQPRQSSLGQTLPKITSRIGHGPPSSLVEGSGTRPDAVLAKPSVPGQHKEPTNVSAQDSRQVTQVGQMPGPQYVLSSSALSSDSNSPRVFDSNHAPPSYKNIPATHLQIPHHSENSVAKQDNSLQRDQSTPAALSLSKSHPSSSTVNQASSNLPHQGGVSALIDADPPAPSSDEHPKTGHQPKPKESDSHRKEEETLPSNPLHSLTDVKKPPTPSQLNPKMSQQRFSSTQSAPSTPSNPYRRTSIPSNTAHASSIPSSDPSTTASTLPHPTPSPSPNPTAALEHALDAFKQRSEATKAADGGCPGFIDTMVGLAVKMAEDAMPAIRQRLVENRENGEG